MLSPIEPAILNRLNPADPNELCVFCWAGLRNLNDGHVAPALYLNAFRDVHAIIKQNWDPGTRARDRDSKTGDRDGAPHAIHYHRSTSACLRAVQGDGGSRPIVLDLDLDYFTRAHPSAERHRQIRLPDASIRQTLDPAFPFMAELLPRLSGMTIALEPGYCGGILNSLRILDTVCHTLFRGAGLSRFAARGGSA